MSKQPIQSPEKPKRRSRKASLTLSAPAAAVKTPSLAVAAARAPSSPDSIKTQMKPHTARSRDAIKALGAEAKAFYHKLKREWSIDDASGLVTLLTAAQALDRLRQAQRILARDGPIYLDRFDAPKQHPATVVEKEARLGLLQALKALNLDISALEGNTTNA